mmetsp:Transcript_37057/g.113360  ORF Transcript_37057/g.113360 Transcript_37057/m.113360 type:complete len:220 (+) Transcript_37057:144-803(+)
MPRQRPAALAATTLCALVAVTGGFAPRARAPASTALGATKVQRKWQKERKKLADEVADAGGGATLDDKGLAGAVEVVFRQGNATRATRCDVGAPLSEVATQADQFIRYKCKKGECGTCEVRVNGKWIRSCVSTVPYVEPGSVFEVEVKPSMVAGTKKSSTFYSFKSFVMGWYNNIIGMVGFVKTSATEGKNFKDRLDGEAEIMARVKARKAEKAAAGES